MPRNADGTVTRPERGHIVELPTINLNNIEYVIARAVDSAKIWKWVYVVKVYEIEDPAATPLDVHVVLESPATPGTIVAVVYPDGKVVQSDWLKAQLAQEVA